MSPILLELHLPVLGQVTVPAYMTLLMVASLVAVGMARHQGERQGLDGAAIVDLGLLLLVLGILGARLLSVLADGKLVDFVHLCTDPVLVPAVDSQVPVCSAEIACDFHYVCDRARGICHPPRDCLAALKFWQGGLTFYGGLLLALPGGLWFARRKRLDPWRMADIIAPGIMLGLAIGRLGCFLDGCCYGTQTHAWLGVRFPGHAQPAHPTQLYEAAAALIVFALLRWGITPRARTGLHTGLASPAHAADAANPAAPSARPAGRVFGWMLVLYGPMRMLIEIVRADPRGSLGPLSTSQILSIPLIAAGILLIRRTRAIPGDR